jgi:hypothetical protein
MTRASLIMLLTTCAALGDSLPKCGSVQKVKRPGVTHEVRTECVSDYVWVAEYYKNKLNGFERYYTPSGKKTSQSWYRNDVKVDSTVEWDTLGHLIGKRYFKKGIQVGGDTTWFPSGKIQHAQQFDENGKQIGREVKWYDETQIQYEDHYAAGICTLSTHYYRNGQKSWVKKSPFARVVDITKLKAISGESWSWSGKPTGKVENGNGTLVILPGDFNNLRYGLRPYQPVNGLIGHYKDTVLIKVDDLDSAAILKYK